MSFFNFLSHNISLLLYLLQIISFRLNLKGNREVYASGFCLDNECWRLYEQKVHNVLTQGLGDRVKSVRVTWRNTPSECIIEDVWDKALNCIFLSKMFFMYLYFVPILVHDYRACQHLILSH